jgi:rare lipoprotein A
MHTAFFKHALTASLLALMLGLAAPTVSAFASGDTTGGAAAPTSTSGKHSIATWYGPGLYGHTTACGQKLTPELVGLASRTLACGTLVRISYDGRVLTAPVLDRGPFGHTGATWDLTSGAAKALEITETVRIATQIVGSLPNTPSLGEPALSAPLSEAAQSSPASAAQSSSASAAGGTTAG